MNTQDWMIFFLISFVALLFPIIFFSIRNKIIKKNSKPTKSGTYKVRCHCENCGKTVDVMIPKAVPLHESPCPYCQCKTIILTSNCHKNVTQYLRSND